MNFFLFFCDVFLKTLDDESFKSLPAPSGYSFRSVDEFFRDAPKIDYLPAHG
jgi:hypothetical protein